MAQVVRSRLLLLNLFQLVLTGSIIASQGVVREIEDEVDDGCDGRDVLECLAEKTVNFQFPAPSILPSANPSLPPASPFPSNPFPPPNPSLPNPFPPNPSFLPPFPSNPFPPNPSIPQPFPPNPSIPQPFPPNPSIPQPFPPNPSIPQPFPPNPSFPQPFPPNPSIPQPFPPNPSIPQPFPPNSFPPNPSVPQPFPPSNPSFPVNPSFPPNPSIPSPGVPLPSAPIIFPREAEEASVPGSDAGPDLTEATNSSQMVNSSSAQAGSSKAEAKVKVKTSISRRLSGSQMAKAAPGKEKAIQRVPWWHKRSVGQRVKQQRLKRSLLQMLREMVDRKPRQAL